MKKWIKIYWPFAKAVIQEFLTYRVNFYIFILGELLQTVVLLYIWKAVYESSGQTTLSGFTLKEMVAYIFAATMTGMLVTNDTHWAVGSDVRSGDIAMNLIKPVGYHTRQLASAVGYWIVNLIFITLPLAVTYFIMVILTDGFIPSALNVVLYLISALMSAIILFAINYAFGLIAFYVNYIFGFIYAKEAIFRFLSGALIPLAFFPTWLQTALNILPFGSLLYTPIMIFLGKYQGTELITQLAIQAIWVIITLKLDHILWKKAVKKLTIVGG